MLEEDISLNESLNLDSIEEFGPATKSRLEESGFKSIKDLVVRGPVDLSETTGMEMNRCVSLCNKARVRLEDLGIIDRSFITATKLYDKRKNEERISTGSKNLDDPFWWRVGEKGYYRTLWRVWNRQDPNMSYYLCNSTAEEIQRQIRW